MVSIVGRGYHCGWTHHEGLSLWYGCVGRGIYVGVDLVYVWVIGVVCAVVLWVHMRLNKFIKIRRIMEVKCGM